MNDLLMTAIDPSQEEKELIWDPEKRWWNGKINRHDKVTGEYDLPARAMIVDVTLREAEEVPGTVLTNENKIAYAYASAAAGFTEMEVGYAGAIAEHRDFVRLLRDENLPVSLSSHTRTYAKENEWREEIDRNVDAGVDILTFVGFASEVGTATTPWLKKEAIPERVTNCVEYARSQGVSVTFGLADCVRTDLNYINACYRGAADAGAERLYVYDGVGAATPDAVRFLVRHIRELAGREIAIGVHCHDTFGTATAAALQAVTAGASVIDAVPLGLGDGAGISKTEEVVAALQVLYGVPTGIDLSQLKELCERVATLFDAPIPQTKALVGSNQYCHSIDSHVAAILRGAWYSWEVIRPEVIGQTRELQFGYNKLRLGQSGALYAKLQQLGYSPTPEQSERVLEKIRAITVENAFATEQDVERVAGEVMR